MGCLAVGSWGTGVLSARPRCLALWTGHLAGRAGERLLPHPGEGGYGGQGSAAGTAHCCFSTENGAPALLPYQFRMEEIEGFRYRCRVSAGQAGAPAGRGGAGGREPGVLTSVSPRTPCAR